MEDDFLKYYENELTFVRKMAEEFAEKFPKVAARLQLEPDKCEDPYMERLLQANAFINAGLHKKIDDDLPEITEPLLGIVAPQYITPIPSMAVVKFEPHMQTVSPSGHLIQRGTELHSRPVGGIPCKFRTVYPVTLWPVEVISAKLSEPRRLVKNAEHAIVIQFKTRNNLNLAQVAWETLRFYIDAPKRHAEHIYELIFNNACHVEYVTSNSKGEWQGIGPAPHDLLPAGFASEEAMVPSLRKEFPGFTLLFEYFCFPEKFLFFDIKRPDGCRPDDMDTLEIWIYLDRKADHDLRLDKDNFKLNCAPVVNLFKQTLPPIKAEVERQEYELIPDAVRTDAVEIYSVEKVTCVSSSGSVREIPPLYSLRHHGQEEDAKREFWKILRSPSHRKGDQGTDVYISFADREQHPVTPEAKEIIVNVTCMNRDLPARISAGDLKSDVESEIQNIDSMRFILKPTLARRPSPYDARQWQIISHLKPNYLPLMSGQEEAFREILRLYDFDNSPITRQIIESIVSINSGHVTRRIGQSFLRGVEITIGFDQQKYAESGLYLFTSVLERFLSQHVSSNSFAQLVAVISPGGAVFKQWPPRRGVRPLL